MSKFCITSAYRKLGEVMNFMRFTAILALFSILTAFGQKPIPAANADEPAFNAEAEYSALAAGEDTGGRAWFELAGKARSTGDLDTASRALENAAAQKFSPARVGMETARIRVAKNDVDGAVAALNALLDSGFTAVGIVTGDPVLRLLKDMPDMKNL